MVQTLEAIKGGGGSIKVGTTGKIGALMTRELNSMTSGPPHSASSGTRAPGNRVSIPCHATTSGIVKPRNSLDGASSSHRSLGISQKTKCHGQKTHRIPMLASDNVALEGTPTRQKGNKGSSLVEVVDIKCGSTERAWTKPLKNRLRKLNFTKLSESVI